MTPEEQEVEAATRRFYEGIEQMARGKGTQAIKDAWHHAPRVTSSHPTGEWAIGWDEVGATWDVFASFGKEGDPGGTHVRDIKVYLYGDIAYTTSVFVAAPTWGGAKMNCTNILRRVDGVWKIIHHHPDRAPSMGTAMEKMATG
jgi:ketosteroid isomerase-like protein